MMPVPIYTPGRMETMWGKDSYIRKQHDGRDWGSTHRPSDLKSNALIITPPRSNNGSQAHKKRITTIVLDEIGQYEEDEKEKSAR